LKGYFALSGGWKEGAGHPSVGARSGTNSFATNSRRRSARTKKTREKLVKTKEGEETPTPTALEEDVGAARTAEMEMAVLGMGDPKEESWTIATEIGIRDVKMGGNKKKEEATSRIKEDEVESQACVTMTEILGQLVLRPRLRLIRSHHHHHTHQLQLLGIQSLSLTKALTTDMKQETAHSMQTMEEALSPWIIAGAKETHEVAEVLFNIEDGEEDHHGRQAIEILHYPL
jgi:hypothetical protein